MKRWHAQFKLYFSLGLNGNTFLVLHLKSRLLNLSLSPPFAPFQSLLAWYLLFQGSKSLKKFQFMFFPNLELWWRSVLLWAIKIPTTIQEMWRCPISQHGLLVHCVIYLWISPYFEESWNFKYGTPPKKHKMEILTMVRKQYQVVGQKTIQSWCS